MKERMKILLSNNVITKESFESILLVIDYFNREWGLSESNEQYQMIMTHLVRATDRIKQGKEIQDGLDCDIYNEMESMSEFSFIKEINSYICGMMGLREVPETENSFFLFNITSLYEMRS
ncbi:PRD domain-containing protein [Vibrio hippocampi]|uniref:PRD domain-containing protein n=1 Tax=Vibrio hippocampi TaxID=654686 RepID=A0ABM8ZF71_9VIBR|nr:PRD domain-containing protein [Vibrio hippocampi]CAH0524898.1 hypothetical protein VHP8226_00573 [Vibrio hippocampi]